MDNSIEVALCVAYAICIPALHMTNRRLGDLLDKSPGLMERVGIDQVDWWFRCTRGVVLLAFTSAGASLPRSTRIVFRLSLFMYILVPLTIYLVGKGVIGD